AIVLEHGKTVFEGGTESAIDYYLNSRKNKIENFEDFSKKQGICKIEVLNGKDKPVDNVLVGQTVKFRINYKNPNKRPLSIALAFYGSHDNFLFACRSDVLDKKFNEENGEAVLIIEKWPFSSGKYTYNTSIHDSNTVLENLIEVGELIVEEGDFYG